MATSRGLRNNNPLNIRKNGGKPFDGEIIPSADPSFKQFEDMAHGYRAAFVILNTYRVKHGLTQLGEMIARWAPASENDTNVYIRTVCKRTGYADVSTVDTRNEYQMKRIVAAMSFVENGVEPDPEQITQGWLLYKLR